MTRTAAFILGCLISTSLQAQTVVRPDPPLDVNRARVRDVLLVLRDSLNAIDAAAGRLQRDSRQTSAASLVSRARVMRDACSSSARAVDPARTTVIGARVVGTTGARRRLDMVRGLDVLSGELAHCRSEFASMGEAGQGERVRDYGNDRAARIQSALRDYERTLSRFLGTMGIKIEPPGASASPLAG